ncbi:hypothetical protein ACP6L2_14895 [Sphingobacterium lactis]|uniref:hypothetical protein n=1 Tax=Sphingobacterium lactis TaxID=797291 RepID=UPI003F8044CE
MNDLKLQVRLLLSAQRAILGKVYPSIRAISVGFEGRKKLNIFCYLDRVIIEEDKENLSDISAEICADIDFLVTNERCIYSLEPFSHLDNLTSWVYMRMES